MSKLALQCLMEVLHNFCPLNMQAHICSAHSGKNYIHAFQIRWALLLCIGPSEVKTATGAAAQLLVAQLLGRSKVSPYVAGNRVQESQQG